MKKILSNVLELKEHYADTEHYLMFKTKALVFLSFLTGTIIFIFSIYRFWHQEYPLAYADIIFASMLFLLVYFVRLRKKYYRPFSTIFIMLAAALISINFNLSQDNHSRILWFSTLLVFTFYLKDRVIGFVMLLFFILLIFISSNNGGSHFNTVENITVIINLSLISIVMFWYDKFQEADTKKLVSYNSKLEKEVKERTTKLHQMNVELQEEVDKEVAIRLEQEQLLFEKNRLAEMGKMLDNIAHQWRQPLMNINASLLNMQREDELKTLTSSLLEKHIETIESTTQYMSNTIDDFRNFFKNDAFKKKENLAVIFSNVFTLLKSATKDIDIDSHITIPTNTTFYKGEMTQVLMSVMVNAIEAMESIPSEEKALKILGVLKEGFYIISIEDTGGGIHKDDLLKIFHPYFSTKKTTGGSGLGLYTSKIIVENHFNGKLLVSNGKQGAVFMLFIPK